ncbi:hypothetical protein ABIC65_003746 [Sphingomonas trueperi]|uniref:pentapeptide repeat-containing protein n=1 Tax=Sphingomonas trueperi TaxID=53317 RepID=UPI003394FA79
MNRDVKMKIDWRSLSTNIADAAAQGFWTTFGGDGVSSGITALINALGSIKLDDDPGEKAWKLFLLSFAWTVDEVRSESKFDAESLRLVVREIIDEAKERVDDGYEQIPATFLSRPTTLPLYRHLRDKFVARRAEFRSAGTETASELSARFDSAFSRAISEIWLRKADGFKSLMQLLEVPGANAANFELQWAAYRQKLIFDFEVSAMFGQEKSKISLAQAYVPLRCSWIERGGEDIGGRKENSYGYLDDALFEWLNQMSVDEAEDDVKLIGGGPGSGKSTSMKRLARVAADMPDVRPLYIPLQHIELEGGLREAITQYFTARTGGAFTASPLSREALEDGPKLLLIFDGLDEIARPGEAAAEVANLFVTKLDQLKSALQGDVAVPLKIIVTGRLPSFQAARKFRGALGKSALEVLGYAPIRFFNGKSDDIMALDQRPVWWRQYAPLAGLSCEVPLALKDDRLSDVTSEPLLCYLLVLSGFAVDNWEVAADNRNIIYQKLIDEVWRRGWGDPSKVKNRQGPGRHLQKSSFNALMETIALAAWLGGDARVATEEGFHSALKLTQGEAVWEEFKSDGGEDVTNLAMNFYLKSSEISHKGFEFTHKSFGEYLAARAVLKLAEEVIDFVPRHVDLALQMWVKATGTGALTHEVLGYMRDEIRLNVAREQGGYNQVSRLFDRMIVLAGTVIDEGAPVHGLSIANWRAAAQIQKNAETMIWAVLNSCILCLQKEGAARLIEIGFDESESRLKLLLDRVLYGEDSKAAILQCFSYMSAKNSDFFAMDLSGSNFSHSDLRGVNFNGCHLMKSNLSHCDLTEARFQRSSLDECNFRGSNIDGANFVDARPLHSDLFLNTIGQFHLSRRTLLDMEFDHSFDENRIYFKSEYDEMKGEWLKKARSADKVWSRRKDIDERESGGID